MSNSAKKSVRKDIGNYSALESLKNTEGGKILINSLQKDIIGAIDAIVSKYKSCELNEMIAWAAKLSTSLAIYRSLNRATKNKKLALIELEALLAEDPDVEGV
jgi:hypothetical protein